MSHHFTTFEGNICDVAQKAIEESIDDAKAEVAGGGGHFQIVVTSPVFAGKNRLQSQRLVLNAIKHLMAGDNAPIHAVDSITTKTP